MTVKTAEYNSDLSDIIVRHFSEVDREVYDLKKNFTTASHFRAKRYSENMSIQIATLVELLKFNRIMTLKTIDEISSLTDPQSALAFRPGPGRAHIAWQFMHTAITEELFATDRLRKTDSKLSDLFSLYEKGSTAVDEIPSLDVIKNTLSQSRENLLETIQLIPEADLELVPAGLQERGWSYEMALKILCWHETHHQGQAHLTLNSWKAEH
tara:strand:- start:320759 stop:321391 length:633 start_codon:yes stop_codon:yes gene_type:complete